MERDKINDKKRQKSQCETMFKLVYYFVSSYILLRALALLLIILLLLIYKTNKLWPLN
jgi:hypothetical protein